MGQDNVAANAQGSYDGIDDDSWQQPQLLGVPATRPATAYPVGGRSGQRLRQAGLVGIAEARAALADASTRAQARVEAAAGSVAQDGSKAQSSRAA